MGAVSDTGTVPTRTREVYIYLVQNIQLFNDRTATGTRSKTFVESGRSGAGRRLSRVKACKAPCPPGSHTPTTVVVLRADVKGTQTPGTFAGVLSITTTRR